MPDLAHPWALLLLVPVLILGGVRLLSPPPPLLHALGEGGEPSEPHRRRPPPPLGWILRLGALALLVLALAGPRTTRMRPLPPRLGVALMVALDLSESMAAPDPRGGTRLQGAVEEVARFVEGRPQDRIGLVTFGREAVTRVPPTTDHAHLLAMLGEVGGERLDDGTALGVGLGLAAHRLLALPSPSRVVILVTDGRSNAGSLDPLTAARAAGSLGVRVHVIGMGEPGGGEEPMHEPILRAVAAATGGRYYPALDRDGLGAVLAEVDALEVGPLPAEAGLVSRSHHGLLLLLAAILLALEAVLWAAPRGRVW